MRRKTSQVSARVTLLVVLALAGAAQSQQALIEKTAQCPTLTRYAPPASDAWGQFPNKPGSAFVTGCANTTSGNPNCTIQNPLTPQQSVNCAIVPAGLKAQIVASELTPGPVGASPMAYLMHFTFDERGRAWVIDTRDYPNTHNDAGTTWTNPPTGNARLTGGKSRILILEDRNGDGAIDTFKVFYTGLAVPTSIEIVKNGVIATVPPYVVYLPKHATLPDTSGTPQIVVSGLGSDNATFDTHFQNNSLTRGLDNFIYGHQGSTGCTTGGAIVGGNAGVSCGGGNIWRFKALAVGSDTNVFQIHSNNGPSNSHGIGQMEDGQWFKSGATVSTHSSHQVRHGAAAQNILNTANIPYNNTANTHADHIFYPATRDFYSWEGSATHDRNGFHASQTSAVSGHDFYTARLLPRKYWNRFGFTCEGMTHLCNQDSLVLNGSSWTPIRLPGPVRSNIFASTDAWSAPLKVRTGPEGALWVNDWYNYLFLHNPATPATNGAWNNQLRAKTRTRLYRIVPADGVVETVLNLTNATEADLVQTLFNRNFVWRLHAQRLLVERGYTESLGNLLDTILTKHRSVDEVGIDGPVLHALWTLHGLKRFTVDSARWNPKLRTLMLHPAWTVRRNVMLALPPTGASYTSLREQCAVNDEHAHVRVQALQTLTTIPVSGELIQSVDGLRTGDTHIGAAYTAAGSGKVTSVAGSARPTTCPAYLDTTAYSVGMPVGIAKGARNLAAFKSVGFDLRESGFRLRAGASLASGELVVSDLRGRAVFRSSYNRALRTWSREEASGLSHPFYVYTFKGVDGRSFGGRIALHPMF